jgi:hypothetical protein
MAWWRLQRSKDSATGARPQASRPLATVPVTIAPTAPDRGWRDLSPLQRSVTTIQPVAPLEPFTAGLAAHQDPRFIAPLAHLISPEAPAGFVDGLVGAAEPRTHAPLGELPLTPAGESGEQVGRTVSPSRSSPTYDVQRASAPWSDSAPAWSESTPGSESGVNTSSGVNRSGSEMARSEPDAEVPQTSTTGSLHANARPAESPASTAEPIAESLASVTLPSRHLAVHERPVQRATAPLPEVTARALPVVSRQTSTPAAVKAPDPMVNAANPIADYPPHVDTVPSADEPAMTPLLGDRPVPTDWLDGSPRTDTLSDIPGLPTPGPQRVDSPAPEAFAPDAISPMFSGSDADPVLPVAARVSQDSIVMPPSAVTPRSAVPPLGPLSPLSPMPTVARSASPEPSATDDFVSHQSDGYSPRAHHTDAPSSETRQTEAHAPEADPFETHFSDAYRYEAHSPETLHLETAEPHAATAEPLPLPVVQPFAESGSMQRSTDATGSAYSPGPPATEASAPLLGSDLSLSTGPHTETAAAPVQRGSWPDNATATVPLSAGPPVQPAISDATSGFVAALTEPSAQPAQVLRYSAAGIPTVSRDVADPGTPLAGSTSSSREQGQLMRQADPVHAVQRTTTPSTPPPPSDSLPVSAPSRQTRLGLGEPLDRDSIRLRAAVSVPSSQWVPSAPSVQSVQSVQSAQSAASDSLTLLRTPEEPGTSTWEPAHSQDLRSAGHTWQSLPLQRMFGDPSPAFSTPSFSTPSFSAPANGTYGPADTASAPVLAPAAAVAPDVQRVEDIVAESSPQAAGTTIAHGSAPSAPAPQPELDLDEMARRLFEPLCARLKAELWLDRERAGLISDARR